MSRNTKARMGTFFPSSALKFPWNACSLQCEVLDLRVMLRGARAIHYPEAWWKPPLKRVLDCTMLCLQNLSDGSRANVPHGRVNTRCYKWDAKGEHAGWK